MRRFVRPRTSPNIGRSDQRKQEGAGLRTGPFSLLPKDYGLRLDPHHLELTARNPGIADLLMDLESDDDLRATLEMELLSGAGRSE